MKGEKRRVVERLSNFIAHDIEAVDAGHLSGIQNSVTGSYREGGQPAAGRPRGGVSFTAASQGREGRTQQMISGEIYFSITFPVRVLCYPRRTTRSDDVSDGELGQLALAIL